MFRQLQTKNVHVTGLDLCYVPQLTIDFTVSHLIAPIAAPCFTLSSVTYDVPIYIYFM